MATHHLRMGDLLVSAGVLSLPSLERALSIQQETGKKLGAILIAQGMVTEQDIISTLSTQMQIPIIDLTSRQLDYTVARKLEKDRALKLSALPVAELESGEVLVAMVDPSDAVAIEEIERRLKRGVRVGVISEKALLSAISLVHKDSTLTNLVSAVSGAMPDPALDLGVLLSDLEGSDAPALKAISFIFDEAVDLMASDIHIEPTKEGLLLRFRVDGALREMVINDAQVSSPLTSRLKIMAHLNISERRLPQDGRFSVDVKGRSFDVRLSTMPGQYGESVVMRLLDKANATRALSCLGFGSDITERAEQLLLRSQGMFLVTGPTGSGKTTTLYSMLNFLNTAERKIVTAEDPVEYQIHRVTQVQANDKIGLSFAEILRSSLRQDPDVILVGEMRDLETASIGVRAAMTGHLVLSTLHTNDTVSAIARLMDLGVAPYLIATSLQGILAQRLLRKVCDGCAAPYVPSKTEACWIKGILGEEADLSHLRVGGGCEQCHQTGYKGRIPVHELLIPTDEALHELHGGRLDRFAEVCFSDPAFQTLAEVAASRVADGSTTIAEALKVSEDSFMQKKRSQIEAVTCDVGH